jgi:hypothetical protein
LVSGVRQESPSMAAEAATGKPELDGWEYWGLDDASGSIKCLRDMKL